MMKRLLPLAVAAAIGLSPSVLSAYGSPPTQRRAPQHAMRSMHPGAVHSASITNVMNDSAALFSTGRGFRFADGRLVLKVDAASEYIFQSNNSAPVYVNSGIRGGTPGDKHGDMITWGVNLDAFMDLTHHLNARMTLVTGNNLRNTVGWNAFIYRHGAFAHLGPEDNTHTVLELNNLYMTYGFNQHVGVLFGFKTSGLTPFTNLLPSNPAPRYSDLFEYTAGRIEAFYRVQGFHFDVGVVDPGYMHDSYLLSSRVTTNGANRSIRNFDLGLSYRANAGDFGYLADFRYLHNDTDLTMLSVMNGGQLVVVQGGSPCAWSMSGELSYANWATHAYFVRLSEMNSSRATGVTVSTKGDSWVSNPAHIFGVDMDFKFNHASAVRVFLDANRHDVLAGLYSHQYGMTLTQKLLGGHAGLNATLMHYDSPSNGKYVKSSQVVALGCSYTA